MSKELSAPVRLVDDGRIARVAEAPGGKSARIEVWSGDAWIAAPEISLGDFGANGRMLSGAELAAAGIGAPTRAGK